MTLPANAARLPHTVSDRPFDPDAVYKYTDAQKALFEASQLRLMWWKFRRHKPALISGIFLGVFYLSILISEFLAPYNLHTRNTNHIYAPPQSFHLFHNGELPCALRVRLRLQAEHGESEARICAEPSKRCSRSAGSAAVTTTSSGVWSMDLPLRLSGREGYAVPARHRPARPRRAEPHHLRRAHLADHRSPRRGRVSLVLGIVIGGMAGYYGGLFDVLSQRLIEVIQSIPSIPLWLALGGDPADHLVADRRLFRHHRDPRPARLDRASRAPCGQSCWRCARRTTSRPRR